MQMDERRVQLPGPSACVSAVLIERLSESRPMVLAAVSIRVPTVAFKFSWTNVCVTRGHSFKLSNSRARALWAAPGGHGAVRYNQL